MKLDPALAEIRKQIDAIDDQLLDLLNQRAVCAQKVAETKQASGEVDSFYRPEREAEVLRRMVANNRGPFSNETVARFFREVMSASLALEKPLAVAFLGPEGTFTQQAAYKHFGHAINAQPFSTIDEIFRAVESGACQFGVVPVENSTEGVITHTLDSFLRSPLLIAGEVALRIHHNLMGKGQGLANLQRVFSHQQSLAQCRQWLDRYLPHAERVSVSSNAEAARMADVEASSAAIAGEVAAELYGLNLLERNIEDEPDNTTRFLVIGHHAVSPTGVDKTSLLISTHNSPGALYNTLEPFARYSISMSKIESRPSRRGVWDYVFFIDVEGHHQDGPLAKALEALENNVLMLKLLGSYPRGIG
ncbi:MAG: prephenate dehydratase [Candidatus Methylumidiphilus alinenensis]|uniref:Bifunctional chorismate mutase/prephenate dehydratase n=1 Tax=Candidatus Methylumidiphilus alinenensis TaxID=2202197 RepID=A0A2W4QVM3_9GAMM|nr:MAG: prephenate dehydratase [Candidatus Methylumidiphilus alinenensis]